MLAQYQEGNDGGTWSSVQGEHERLTVSTESGTAGPMKRDDQFLSGKTERNSHLGNVLHHGNLMGGLFSQGCSDVFDCQQGHKLFDASGSIQRADLS